MRCSFGYTVKSPYVERRVKYYDENGIHDESVQTDDELIALGTKLRDGGYPYVAELGNAETKMFGTEPSDPQYKKVLTEFILIVKNFFSQNRFIVTLYMTAAFWTLCLIK